MRLDKRGSIEIGVNTIVILVIAITLLGLGVVFVRNLFDKMGDTVGIINPIDITNPPTADQPIKVTPSQIEMKAGKDKVVEVLVYNKDETQKFNIKFGVCSTGVTPYIETVPNVEIAQGDYKGFKILVYAKDGGTSNSEDGAKLQPKTHICQIIAEGDSPTNKASLSQQFELKVTS